MRLQKETKYISSNCQVQQHSIPPQSEMLRWSSCLFKPPPPRTPRLLWLVSSHRPEPAQLTVSPVGCVVFLGFQLSSLLLSNIYIRYANDLHGGVVMSRSHRIKDTAGSCWRGLCVFVFSFNFYSILNDRKKKKVSFKITCFFPNQNNAEALQRGNSW